MNIKTSPFVVRPKLMFFAAIIWWFICWIILPFFTDLFAYDSSSALGEKTGIIIRAVFRIFWIFSGPFLTIYLSWQIKVEYETITVFKYFRLLKRRYAVANIKDYELVPKNKHVPPKIKIVFDDCKTVVIDSYTSGFKKMWDYLEKRS